MRGSDILKPAYQKARKWITDHDMHVGRISWEDVQPSVCHGCSLNIRWELKPTKTDQAVTNGFEKSFLVDDKLSALSAAQSIRYML